MTEQAHDIAPINIETHRGDAPLSALERTIKKGVDVGTVVHRDKLNGLRSTFEEKVDEHIGRCLRHRRKLLGLTQMDLGDATGQLSQQIQKYECGSTRISASRLHTLAQALRVPVQYFYQHAPTSEPVDVPSGLSPTETPDAIELMESYAKLPERVRASLRNFVKALSETKTA